MIDDRPRRLSPLFTWRSALVDSDLDPTQRHVALTLSLHMSERGDSAFPSLDTLAAETGRHRSTVIRALNGLDTKGWLERTPGGGLVPGRPGREGRPTIYRAVIPPAMLDLAGTVAPRDSFDDGERSHHATVGAGQTVAPRDPSGFPQGGEQSHGAPRTVAPGAETVAPMRPEDVDLEVEDLEDVGRARETAPPPARSDPSFVPPTEEEREYCAELHGERMRMMGLCSGCWRVRSPDGSPIPRERKLEAAGG